jgi:hypothetical protein
MASECTAFRPFTIRVPVRGTLEAFARLLDQAGDAPRGSMLGALAVHDEMNGMPRYELKPGGVMIFEAYVEEPKTAEEAFEQLVAELKSLGFESVAP